MRFSKAGCSRHPSSQLYFPTPVGSRGVPKPNGIRSPFQHVLGILGSLLPVGRARKGRCPGSILIRCLHHLNWPPLDSREQRLYSELLPDVRTPHPISKARPSHPSEKAHFSCLNQRSHSYSHYSELIDRYIDTDRCTVLYDPKLEDSGYDHRGSRNFDRLVN